MAQPRLGDLRRQVVVWRSGVALTVAGVLVGLLVTALILWSPFLTYGLHSPSLHLVLNTADACIALLVAYLVHRRLVRRPYWQDWFLAQGMVLLAVAALGLGPALAYLTRSPDRTLDVWLPLALRTAGALCILAAALSGGRPVRSLLARRHAWVPPLALTAATSVSLWAVRARLPVAVTAERLPTSGSPLMTAHPWLPLAQAVAALCFFVASLVFAVQSFHRHDELLVWLGPAFALAAFARVNYLLFPSLYTDWLYTGDVLRTGSYLLLLVGAGRELQQYWDAQSRAAVLEDRRRLARELHDGVIQELAYIRTESHALPADVPAGDRIIAACDRGLDEARAAVQALGRPSHEPLGFVLHRAARELADRYHIDLEVEVDDTIDVQPDQQHALMRISREAVSNAVRHGGAGRVQVQLTCRGGVRRLLVRDDGKGFDVPRAVTDSTGYGLVSMRERAKALPGTLDIQAERGHGSLVTVTW